MDDFDTTHLGPLQRKAAKGGGSIPSPPALPGFIGTTNLSVTPSRPAHPSRASGWSSLTTQWGFPCCARFPLCTCRRHYPGVATGCLLCSLPQPYQPSPIRVPGRPTHRPFRGLLGVHSRYGLHTRTVTVFRDGFTEGFNRFVTSTVAPLASGWSSCRVGLSPTGKRRLSTAHPQSGRLGRAM